jgi:uncharacterized protein (TIGR00730 family)
MDRPDRLSFDGKNRDILSRAIAETSTAWFDRSIYGTIRNMALASVCVFCGSSLGNDNAYKAAAEMTGRAIAKRGLTLVYGGARVGLMGSVADGALAEGGEVVGVLPRALQEKELAHASLSKLHVVNSMHERKALMAKLSDGFIALPGGIGTFEEIFEIWTWGQLGFHTKPAGFLNVAGFYDRLYDFIAHAVTQGFMRESHQRMMQFDSDIGALLDAFERYEPPSMPKWIGTGQT